MSDTRFRPDPPPLGSEATAAARLLAQAEHEFRGGLDEAAAFRRLERSRRRRGVVLWATCTLGAVAAGLAFFTGSHREPHRVDRVEVTAESRVGAPRLEPSAAPAPAARAQPTPPDVAPVIAAPTTPRPPKESTAARSESECHQLSKGGNTERAIECFRALARADGLGSEVALYEAARLTADSARDPGRALALLGEYQKRFPSGALRSEATWLRVRSLQAVGRSGDALTESESLLASPAGRALSSELHWLRGRIFEEDQQDCGRAVSEYLALVGEAGARGDEAELRRARCLERLGRSTDAALAYQHYLARPDARHGSEARERLSALTP